MVILLHTHQPGAGRGQLLRSQSRVRVSPRSLASQPHAPHPPAPRAPAPPHPAKRTCFCTAKPSDTGKKKKTFLKGLKTI